MYLGRTLLEYHLRFYLNHCREAIGSLEIILTYDDRVVSMAKNCLVVDDSKIVRVMARKILEGLGFEVFDAENGQEALDFCLKSPPDCVLLDWNMPVMSGLDFLKKIRAEAVGKNMKVIFCTTKTDADSVKQGMAAGANEYIMKPFDEGVIKSKLSEIGLI